MNYQNFDLRVDGRGWEYTITVDAPTGQDRVSVRFPFSDAVLERLLQMIQFAILSPSLLRRTGPSPYRQAVDDCGRQLFTFLFPAQVLSHYQASQEEAQRKGFGLRIRLQVTDPKLACLPWELLYDPAECEHVCLNKDISLVHCLTTAQPVQPLPFHPPLRILMMTAPPQDLSRTKLSTDLQLLEAILVPLQEQGKIDLRRVAGQTREELQKALAQGPWHILHIIGRVKFDAQRDEGVLLLVDEAGNDAPFTITELAQMLVGQSGVGLVLLHAGTLESELPRDVYPPTAMALLRQGLQAVVTLPYEMMTQAVLIFTHTFYDALAQGGRIDTAISEARTMLSVASIGLAWSVPALYVGSR